MHRSLNRKFGIIMDIYINSLKLLVKYDGIYQRLSSL